MADQGEPHPYPHISREEQRCSCWVKYVHKANKALDQQPELYDALVGECRRFAESGVKRFSLELPWASLRVFSALTTGDDDFGFKLNNNLRAPIQRMIVGDEAVDERIRHALDATISQTNEKCPRHRDGWEWDTDLLSGRIDHT
jgi:hypothetical protein